MRRMNPYVKRMKPIPNSPRAEYDRLRVRIYAEPADGASLDPTTRAEPLAEAESTGAKGREELEVWIETCGQLGIPLPEWTLQQKRKWRSAGWLAVGSSELLNEESDYPNMARLVRNAYGERFVALFQREEADAASEKEPGKEERICVV